MDKLLGPKEEPKEYKWARDAYEWDPHRAAVEAKTGETQHHSVGPAEDACIAR
jgi:hypothetical protein